MPEGTASESENRQDGRPYIFTVPAELDGERLDRALSVLLSGEDASRSFIKQLIRSGDARIMRDPDGPAAERPANKPAERVEEGDVLIAVLPDRTIPDILPENIPLDILYEDEDVLVADKPKGMVVHPAAGHWSGTLVNAVMYHCMDPDTGETSLSGINGVLRPGIVHRIDRDTTGSIIVCKNDAAHRSIAAQLAAHSLTRRYRAIVCGRIRDDELTIDRPVGRDLKDRKKMAVTPSGKPAVTHVTVLERFRDYTYVECRLETGRTHQIRVHMAFAGHPLAGDTVYGGKRAGALSERTQGQCLHAMVLGFTHPRTGEYIETVSPLPAYFVSLLEDLRRQSD